MKVVLAVVLLGLAVTLIDAAGNQEETALERALEGPMEQTRGGDLLYSLIEKALAQMAAEKRAETLDEGALTRSGDLQSDLLEKRASAEAIAAIATAATEAAKLVYQIGKDGINLIWSLTGMATKPYVHMINFELDSNGVWQSGQLPDGDIIRISKKTDPTPTKAVRFTLKAASGWWKALTLHRGNTFHYEIVSTQDGRRDSSNHVEYRDVLENFVVLSKAKAFGVHTNMYWIQNSYVFSPQYEWTIEWQRDYW